MFTKNKSGQYYGPGAMVYYERYTNTMWNFLYWEQYRTFAKDSEMIRRAKMWYAGP
jgi:hypothetical protein